MESQEETTFPRYEYTGECLRWFLQKHGITYKQAAAELHIDKNTVGKAVRGGNLNIDIVLRICNVYGLKITDFFKVVKSRETAEVADGKMLAEAGSGYLSCGRPGSRIGILTELMKDGGQKLEALTDIYRQCQDTLDAIAEDGKTII